ncbi:Far upstream element-binding protein 3 [Tetrabaena socialis]|uniref:Far upstream element-binding protein 3 n=1 Tax=Tetrabaena socialis TaxID=47790 RepID=A0A2J7ZWC7_9CHLO|nr:Far upstream element-binding protein 3 [Tetrabaena socialis]|eukprot:PNH04564.1 Far upstream element-binding protein 3 [Tetrabaena socialis]
MADQDTAAPTLHAGDVAAGDDAHLEGLNPSVTEAILGAGRNRALELASLFAAQAGQHSGDKRKLDDGSEGPELKRPAGDVLGILSEAPAVLPSSSFLSGDAALATETVMCPSDKVGRVIGRAGATIRDLEASTSTRIQVDHKAPGDKPVTISGMREDVDRAKRTVQDLIAGVSGVGADAGAGGGGGGSSAIPSAGEVQKTLECPQGIVGRVIGRGGETIRTLQQASGAHILVNQDFPDGVPRQITVSGSQDAVERASNMVAELIAGDHANTQAVIQRFGLGSTEVLECPKVMVGRIIGKGGETIKDLQKRFNASIQIDQASTPCKVTITGPSSTLSAARRAIEELVRSTSSAPPVGGKLKKLTLCFNASVRAGSLPAGLRPAPGPYNAPYGQPYNPPAYGGGYSNFPVPAPSYGAPAGYPPYSGYSPYPAAASHYGAYSAYGPGGAPTDPYANASAYQGASQPPSASVWQPLQDDQGRTYFYNSSTGQSQWEKPADL